MSRVVPAVLSVYVQARKVVANTTAEPTLNLIKQDEDQKSSVIRSGHSHNPRQHAKNLVEATTTIIRKGFSGLLVRGETAADAVPMSANASFTSIAADAALRSQVQSIAESP